MDKDRIKRIIGILQDVYNRPVWYLGHLKAEHVIVFTGGLYTGLQIDGAFEPISSGTISGIRSEIGEGLGLKSASYVAELKTLGYSDREIIEKLLLVEIEVWKQILEQQG